MEGFPNIGSIYLLKAGDQNKGLLVTVIQNNINNNTTTLQIIGDCPSRSEKIVVHKYIVYGAKSIPIKEK